MILPRKRNASPDHDHTFATHNVGADLQRRVCTECGHVSIDLADPTSIRSEVRAEKAGLFRAVPEFVYELAEALARIPSFDPEYPRFGERREQ